jgi:hypothetical protein
LGEVQRGLFILARENLFDLIGEISESVFEGLEPIHAQQIN